MENFLINYSFYICVFYLLFFLVVSCLNFKNLFKVFRSVKKKTWIGLFFIFILALVLRFTVVPHTSHVFYDEFAHINAAKNFSTAKFMVCEMIIDGECLKYSLSPWMPGYQFILFIVFSIFGSGITIAYAFNAVLGALTVVPLFLSIYLLFKDHKIALVGSSLLALSPLHLKFSGTSALATSSFFFIAISVLSAALFIKRSNLKTFLFFVSASAYMIFIRPENVLMFLILIVLILWQHGRLKYGYSWLLLYLPHLMYIIYIWDYNQQVWISNRDSFFWGSILKDNFFYWFSNDAIPLTLFILALVGMIYAIKKKQKAALLLFVYFIIHFLFLSLVFKGDLANPFTDGQRLVLSLYFAVILLAVYSLGEIFKSLAKFSANFQIVAMVLIVSVLIGNHFFLFSYIKRDIIPPVVRSLYEKEIEINDKIDESCIFISSVPYYSNTLLSRSSVSIEYLFQEDMYDQYLENKCLVFEKGWFCQADIDGYCGRIEQSFNLIPVESGSEELYYLEKINL